MPGQHRRTFLKISGGVLGGIAVGATVTAATSADRFIVDTSGLKNGALARAGLTVVHDLAAVDLAVVTGSESDLESVTTDYAPDTVYELDLPEQNDAAPTESATDETFYPYQWDKQAQRIPEVHDITRGEGTRVGIIDSGIAAEHPDLQHAVNRDLSRNLTDDGKGTGFPYGGYHGTHVSGIVAANDQNGVGVVGSAPGTELVDYRVFTQEPGASFADILAAMYFSAVDGCEVANLSLGAYPVERKMLGEFYGGVLNRTMTWVTSQGTLLVVAAGNDAADLQHDGGGVTYVDVDDDGEKERVVHSAFVSLPNENARAVSVSATGPIGYWWDATAVGDEEEPAHAPAVYTNYGTNAITVGAPGGNYSIAAFLESNDDDDEAYPWYFDLVLNTYAEMTSGGGGGGEGGKGGGKGPNSRAGGKPSGSGDSAEYGYSWAAGTSMAAPQVAGAAALVKSVDSSLNPGQVESILKQTASVPQGYDKTYYGAGFVDVLGAVEKSRK